jgi:hypothetical protein
MRSLASAKEPNQLASRQSRRSVPLKLSMKQFSTGLPGRMKRISIPRSAAQRLAGELRAVVHPQLLRLAMLGDQAIEHPDDSLGRQRKIDFNRQALPMKLVEDVEQPDGSPSAQRVVHEIHRPALRGGRGSGLATAARCGDQLLSRFLPQRETLEAIQAQNPLPIDREALAAKLQPKQVAPMSRPQRRELEKSAANPRIFPSSRPIAGRRPVCQGQSRRSPLAQLESLPGASPIRVGSQ